MQEMETNVVRDQQIVHLIGRIAEHYQTNIASRFIRPILLQLALDKPAWDLVDGLTIKKEGFQYREILMDELYQQIAAAARLFALARRDLAPNLKNRIAATPGNSQEKIIRDMAVATFPSNLDVFADLLRQLFAALVQLDNADTKNGRRPMHTRMTEIADLKLNLGLEN